MRSLTFRARLDACEIKGAAQSEPSQTAPTPPLEALGCLILLASAYRRKVLNFVDTREAHLNGKAQRKSWYEYGSWDAERVGKRASPQSS